MINLSEDRILDFLDGRLATPDEEELLHTLAVSPERRQVMREHMKLREVTSSIARQDRFSVPDYVSDQLFSKLEGMGYEAPASTEALLSRTPQYISVAGAAAVATAVGSGWRIGAMSLLTASIMSFILGAGAYYVFGSSLGLRTRSQELALARHRAVSNQMASARSTAPQYDVALAQPVSKAEAKIIANGAKNISANGTSITSGAEPAPLEANFIGPVDLEGQLAAASSEIAGSSAGDAVSGKDISISYTPPVKSTYSANVTAPQKINDILPFWPDVIPSPLAQDRGTISFQYSGGLSPNSTTVQWGHLLELKIGFTLWDYFAGSASMGFLSSFESVPQKTVQQNVKVGTTVYPIANVVNFSTSDVKTTTLIGFEGGITLDHLGVPFAAMAGIMYSGEGAPYYRGSLMMHFEPVDKMVVSGGIEGLLYNHSLQTTDQQASTSYPTYLPTVNPSGINHEWCGLFGPSIQIGWHF